MAQIASAQAAAPFREKETSNVTEDRSRGALLVEIRAATPGLGFGAALACIVLVALDLRPGLISMGPLLPAISHDFGLSHAAAALLTSIPDILLGVLALPAPGLARRFGRDRVIVAALVLLGISIAIRAYAPNKFVLFSTTAGVGAGIAMSGVLISSFIKASYPKRAAFLTGIYATALSLGSAGSAALTAPVAAFAGSWRYGAGVWSLLGISAIGAWWVIARNGRALAPVTQATEAHRLPWRNKTAWLIALYFGSQNFLFYALISWISPFFQEQRVPLTRAGLILATFTVAFTAGNPFFGSLSKSLDRRSWLALSAALAATGLIVMVVAPNSAPFIYLPVTAFGMGGAFTLGMTLPLDNTKDAAEASAWTAFVLLVAYLIAATGPLSVGALRDLTGSFSASWVLLLAVALCMLALTPFLQLHVRGSEQGDDEKR